LNRKRCPARHFWSNQVRCSSAVASNSTRNSDRSWSAPGGWTRRARLVRRAVR
jgi:hypothetical protein